MTNFFFDLTKKEQFDLIIKSVYVYEEIEINTRNFFYCNYLDKLIKKRNCLIKINCFINEFDIECYNNIYKEIYLGSIKKIENKNEIFEFLNKENQKYYYKINYYKDYYCNIKYYNDFMKLNILDLEKIIFYHNEYSYNVYEYKIKNFIEYGCFESGIEQTFYITEEPIFYGDFKNINKFYNKFNELVKENRIDKNIKFKSYEDIEWRFY